MKKVGDQTPQCGARERIHVPGRAPTQITSSVVPPVMGGKDDSVGKARSSGRAQEHSITPHQSEPNDSLIKVQV